MAKREPITKKMRFEIFKRDKFTCQYCGRMAPDVILEVDHIKPVSKGGKNEFINLVTSCRDCNRGKKDRELSDNSTVKVQQKQLLEIADRKEQLEMLLEWRQQLEALEIEYVTVIENVFSEKTGFEINEHGRNKLLKLLKEFEFQYVLEATEIAIDTYFDNTSQSSELAFSKIGGICFNKKRQNNDPRYYYANYLKKGCRSRFTYFEDNKIEAFVFKNITSEIDFENAKTCLMNSRNWTEFRNELENIFGNRP